MSLMRAPALAVCALIVAGCVSAQQHKETLDELEKTRQASAQTTREFDQFKKKANAELQALEQESAGKSDELLATQTSLSKTHRDLEDAQEQLEVEQTNRRDAERELSQIKGDYEQVTSVSEDLRRERDQLRAQAESLRGQYETAQQKLASDKAELTDAKGRIAALEERGAALSNELLATQTDLGHVRRDLQSAQRELTSAQDARSEAESKLAQLQYSQEQSERLSSDVRRERDQLQNRIEHQGETIRVQQQALTSMQEDEVQLHTQLREQSDRLTVEAAEKERLERERVAKEEEIRRLTRTRDELNDALQTQIERGEIQIQQVRDRLRINMVDRVLFDSGETALKPTGLEVLKRVSDVLTNVTDKQVRIEGHTDNVPIGVKLRKRYATNWELSTARATSVVRYLIEPGGLDPVLLTAVGYADNRPVATNDTPEGRAENRRIEILLYPKDLAEIARF